MHSHEEQDLLQTSKVILFSAINKILKDLRDFGHFQDQKSNPKYPDLYRNKRGCWFFSSPLLTDKRRFGSLGWNFSSLIAFPWPTQCWDRIQRTSYHFPSCLDILRRHTFHALLKHKLYPKVLCTHLYALHCNRVNYPNNTPGPRHSKKRMACIAIVRPRTGIEIFICLQHLMLRNTEEHRLLVDFEPKKLSFKNN